MARSSLSARSFFRDPVGFVGAHGGDLDAVRLTGGRSEFVLVRDPETVWRVLVTDADSFRPGKWKRRAHRFVGDTLNTLDGDDHRRRRLLLQPALDRRRIARFSASIVARAGRACARWEDGGRVELRDTLDRLALEIAGEVLLSTDLEAESAELADALAAVMAAVPRLTPPIRGTKGGRALARVDASVRRVVAERRRSPGGDDDLLRALLDAGLPPRTVRGEVIAFLLAAVDEPPSALEAAWYLLARNPGAERRLQHELDTRLSDQPPDPADEVALPYLRAVLRETLRLFPPARHIDRCPVRELTIGDTRAGVRSNVLVSPLVTHRDPRLYPRAADFVPERWLEDEPRRNGARGAYVPFGAGAHTCIGEPLAQTIMTLVLATVARRWRVSVDADVPAPGPRSSRLVATVERR